MKILLKRSSPSLVFGEIQFKTPAYAHRVASISHTLLVGIQRAQLWETTWECHKNSEYTYLWSSNTSLSCEHVRDENIYLQEDLCKNVPGISTHNSPELKPTQMCFFCTQLDKQIGIHLHDGLLLAKKKSQPGNASHNMNGWQKPANREVRRKSINCLIPFIWSSRAEKNWLR